MQTKIYLTKNGIIGRDTEADYYLPDSSISRIHCEIIIKEGELRIKDLGSKNGVIVNHKRIQDSYLQEGSLLKIGKLCFYVSNENGVYTLNQCLIDETYEKQESAELCDSDSGGAETMYAKKENSSAANLLLNDGVF